LNDEDLADFLQLFRSIKTEHDQYSAYSREVLKSYLNILLLKGRKHYQQHSESTARPGREQEIYNQFMELVQKHYLDFNSLADYAARIHITPKHLSETIKSISGHPALRIVHKARLHHAKSLLRQTSMTVSQIAYELGFESADYFSAFFKRHAGESPMKFRNS
jgi:AraC family transcriptional activator of pobA